MSEDSGLRICVRDMKSLEATLCVHLRTVEVRAGRGVSPCNSIEEDLSDKLLGEGISTAFCP
jgi:hypothetical protein